MTRRPFYMIAAVGVLAATPAVAEETASAGFRISLQVPEVCELEVPQIDLALDQQEAGASVFEMCNSTRGFSLLASHRPLETSENVQISYGGNTAELSATGMSLIGTRHGPSVGNVPLFVRAAHLSAALSINLAMTVI
jgi:hypothetical protein